MAPLMRMAHGELCITMKYNKVYEETNIMKVGEGGRLR
jgi:hypothetical protein